MNKNEAKMFEKIKACIETINLEYITDFKVTKENLINELQSILLYLDEKQEKEQIQFVHGIGKRKSKLQKY